MARRQKLPLERYKKVAKELASISPKIKAISKKKTLTANDKRAITRAEDKAHKWRAGSQRIIPLTPSQVKKLKDKSVLIPGFNAVVDRNLGRTPKADVRGGELFIRDNGRDAHIILADSSNKEEFANVGASLFKGRKRRNVWVRFANGRSDTAFVDKKALLRFLVKVWEQYQPDWDKQGLPVEQMMVGFEVYERGVKPPAKPKTKPKAKPRKTKKRPVRKAAKKISGKITAAIKKRFKPTKPTKKLAPVKKFKVKKGARLPEVKPSKQFKPIKIAKKKSTKALPKVSAGRWQGIFGDKNSVGKRKKNRRNRL